MLAIILIPCTQKNKKDQGKIKSSQNGLQSRSKMFQAFVYHARCLRKKDLRWALKNSSIAYLKQSQNQCYAVDIIVPCKRLDLQNLEINGYIGTYRELS